MPKTEFLNMELFSRCEKQGCDLAQEFRRVLDETVTNNPYDLPDYIWWQCVCVAMESLLRSTMVPKSAISKHEFGNSGKKYIEPEYLEFGLEKILGTLQQMARTLNDWHPGAVYNTNKYTDKPQSDSNSSAATNIQDQPKES